MAQIHVNILAYAHKARDRTHELVRHVVSLANVYSMRYIVYHKNTTIFYDSLAITQVVGHPIYPHPITN